MKKHVFTKTFNDESELNVFVNNNVGDKYYWTIPTKYISINDLTTTIVIGNSSRFHFRKRICDENGFEHEWKDV